MNDIKTQSDVLLLMADAMSLPLTKAQRQGVFDDLARGDRVEDVAVLVEMLIHHNLRKLTQKGA
jgi:hypothetical protein